ncbi:MAG TPA: ComEC/Rec2 family competence protein [Candidatus Limnocylindria bacterium]|nr:ComEC/Rec2 family competence protein [Candidatus Limnocylindria bacterium]
MTRVLAVPLLPAALVSAGVAWWQPGGPLWPLLVPASVALVLARMSADRSRWALWSAIAAALGLAALARVAPPPAALLPDPLAAARDGLAEVLLRLVPEPEGAVVVGIVLGERGAISRELADAFARSGTAHLLAVSGFNMTLVASAVAFAVRGRLAPVGVAVATASALAAYALLVGPSPSVLRAGLMALVASLGLALGRASAGANALCLSVCVLVALDPAIATAVGFQLSVAATAGLLAFQRPIAARLERLPSVLGEGIATTLAASLPTIPIVAAVFGRVSVVSPLANVVAVPLFAPLLGLGMATAALGAIVPDAARPLGLACYAVATAMRRAVEVAADVPGASAEVPRGGLTGVVLVLAGALIVAARAPLADAGRRLVRAVPRLGLRATAGVVLAAVILTAAALGSAAPVPRVRALDVGQGDAFLLELGGAVVLIDGGPDPGRLLALLGGALPPWQRRIDLVVLTHAHQDHGAGLLSVFGRYDVGLAVEPRGLEDTPLSRLWAERVARSGVPRRALAAGDRLRVGALELDVLAPGERSGEYVCLVVRVSAGGVSLLFTGDATDETLADLLLDPAPLRSTIYVPPHHGAATPHADALVAAVRPRLALLSVGASNRYGHPTPATLRALAAVATYRTDRHGTVEVQLDGGRLLVRTRSADVPAPRRRSVPDAAAPRRARDGARRRRADGERRPRALAEPRSRLAARGHASRRAQRSARGDRDERRVAGPLRRGR